MPGLRVASKKQELLCRPAHQSWPILQWIEIDTGWTRLRWGEDEWGKNIGRHFGGGNLAARLPRKSLKTRRPVESYID